MNKPYVICHMLQSIDGKISGHFFDQSATIELAKIYKKMSETFQADAILYGSITLKEIYTSHVQINLNQYQNQNISKTEDYIVNDSHKKWMIAMDPQGTLNWDLNVLKEERLKDKNIIEVVCENVSSSYLAHLQTMGISYIFGGKDYIDLKQVLAKLKHQFNIQKIVLQGGGIVNESFLMNDLIDEISLIISPVVDGNSQVPTAFESNHLFHSLIQPHTFTISKVKVLSHSGLWIDYIKN